MTFKKIFSFIVEVKRVSSGISNLDGKIQGGFPSGSVVAFVGRPGIGKTTSGIRFIDQGCSNKEKTLIITTDTIIAQMKLQ